MTSSEQWRDIYARKVVEENGRYTTGLKIKKSYTAVETDGWRLFNEDMIRQGKVLTDLENNLGTIILTYSHSSGLHGQLDMYHKDIDRHTPKLFKRKPRPYTYSIRKCLKVMHEKGFDVEEYMW